MEKQNNEFQNRLLATFRIEADEHLQAISSGLLALETPPIENYTGIVEQVFREVHSLKGAARAVNLPAVETLCQVLENVFAELKRNRRAVAPALFDLLHQALGALDQLLDPSADATLGSALIQRIESALQGQSHAPEPAVETVLPAHRVHALPKHPASETIRIATTKLDAVLRQAEELLAPRLASVQRAQDLSEAAAALALWKKARVKIQPVLRRVTHRFARTDCAGAAVHERAELPKLLEYLDDEQRTMQALEFSLAQLRKSAEHDQRVLSSMADGLLHDVREMHLLPFSSLTEIFPRFARALAHDQGKEVTLTLRGGEIVIDRRILEEMKDPLLHMLRNCIDHGIETPTLRVRRHKPPQGACTLAMTQLGNGKVEILVTDDGAGIDVTKVKAAACKLGLVCAEDLEQMDESAVRALIFQSGISTSALITDVSGRGLGLAIVREKVERLGGAIVFESTPALGTRFRITLPLTLATLRGVLVRVGTQLCIIPAASVEQAARVICKDIRTVENREMVVLDGQVIALVDLGDVLEMPRPVVAAESHALVLVLDQNQTRLAFRVDEILGEQEIRIKNLGPQLARVRNIAGADMLSTGQVALVLNVADLLQSALRQAPPPAPSTKPSVQPSILVVEDSITARALLKNILESAGYRVSVAVDGIDAYTVLKTASFDLLVSDVEMPRMDGFELTVKIRADKQLAALPVVLVTALESRAHRERGIDVGANAYIVKSSFDQSNLLEIIRRLL